MGARLARRFGYVGVERDAAAAAVARERITAAGGDLVENVAELAPDREFDVVCAFEVLEHLEDDVVALRQWRARLRPGGALVLSVPAHQHRFGPWDVRVGHFRRYDPPGLAERLSQAGLEPVSLRLYGFPIGFLLERVRDILASRSDVQGDHAARTARSGRSLQPRDPLAVATWLGTWPFRMLQHLPYADRAGTGLVAVARRRD